ncbi:type I-E CRISPR-associated protein Cse2/CasB [Saccharomonospora sp. NPDC006951]
MASTAQLPPPHRRGEFIAHLEKLARQLNSDNQHVVSAARRTLAQLRRSVTGQRHEHDALAVVFEHQPPRDEENSWLLVAGLFALNARERKSPRLPLGRALRELDSRRDGITAQTRLRQLLAADEQTLPQHLRSTLRLLADHGITVDFHSLLDNVIVLLNPEEDEENRRDVKWKWATDFHRQPSSSKKTNGGDDSQENDE